MKAGLRDGSGLAHLGWALEEGGTGFLHCTDWFLCFLAVWRTFHLRKQHRLRHTGLPAFKPEPLGSQLLRPGQLGKHRECPTTLHSEQNAASGTGHSTVDLMSHVRCRAAQQSPAAEICTRMHMSPSETAHVPHLPHNSPGSQLLQQPRYCKLLS